MALIILLGTTKGVFLVSTDDRRSFSVTGPFCDGWPINHVIGDPDTGTLWAGGGGEWFGAGVWRSDDLGRNWSLVRLSPGTMDDWAANDAGFAEMIGWSPAALPFGKELAQVWSLRLSHGTLYAGTKPAELLASTDRGATWEKLAGLAEHPSRDSWTAGAAGLILHTILADPDDPAKLWVAISAAGVLATEDGGRTWERRNRLANSAACEGHDHPAAPAGGETGHCVHNMARAPQTGGDLLYQQNHHGVWRSSDGGRSWDDVTEGLPSTFGFPIAVHPRDPAKIWVLPLNGDMAGRFPPGASAAVWHSADAGARWADQRSGLPQEGCFFTVLRQGMATDRADPAGVYFGTNSGSVFGSFDEGANWTEIARHLPTILSVETLEPDLSPQASRT